MVTKMEISSKKGCWFFFFLLKINILDWRRCLQVAELLGKVGDVSHLGLWSLAGKEVSFSMSEQPRSVPWRCSARDSECSSSPALQEHKVQASGKLQRAANSLSLGAVLQHQPEWAMCTRVCGAFVGLEQVPWGVSILFQAVHKSRNYQQRIFC